MSEAIHSFFGPGTLVKKLISKKVLTTPAYCAIMTTVSKRKEMKL